MWICMKRVGIITHYYNSRNYGGVLQAYALCRVLRDQGYDCEQICYDSSAGHHTKKTVKMRIADFLSTLLFKRKWERRRTAFARFREQIAHSKTVYTKDTVAQCADEYDVFVTGSDQVWNLKAYHSAYFLDFVSSDKCKLSYAASLCADCLDEDEKALFQNSLRDYQAISVRERDAAELLSPLVSQKVHRTVDPVFLLSSAQWDELCADRIVTNEYVFCYFLGSDPGERKLARQYAAKKGLTLVTIPYVHQRVEKEMSADFGFGDIRLHDVSPEQFVSLIKYAQAVFTDSFHAVAFSTIYRKDFFVFERANEQKMASRIRSILESVGAQDRFCVSEKRNVEYLLSRVTLDYDNNQTVIQSLTAESLRFLIENIG